MSRWAYLRAILGGLYPVARQPRHCVAGRLPDRRFVARTLTRTLPWSACWWLARNSPGTGERVAGLCRGCAGGDQRGRECTPGVDTSRCRWRCHRRPISESLDVVTSTRAGPSRGSGRQADGLLYFSCICSCPPVGVCGDTHRRVSVGTPVRRLWGHLWVSVGTPARTTGHGAEYRPDDGCRGRTAAADRQRARQARRPSARPVSPP